MLDAGPFAVGASVLVPHTDRFYEAKVLKSQKRDDGQWYYLIHYIGWNKKWDEWVEASGLQAATEAAAMGLLQPPAKKQKPSAGGATAAAAAAAWQRGKASHDGGAQMAAGGWYIVVTSA
jgi:mortality factor 4-like protein 1